MARKPPTQPSRNAELSIDAMRLGISRLEKRLEEVHAFDPKTIRQRSDPSIAKIRASVDDALVRTFGNESIEYQRYSAAASFLTGPIYINQETPLNVIWDALSTSKDKSVALLEQAIESLRERLGEIELQAATPHVSRSAAALIRRVFIVHGHDEGAREAVARFLERLGFDTVILHEQANRGRTVIEKVEAHGEVGFAVVLLTHDDEGCVRGGDIEPRARQNVLLELGYFIGRLGRENICALKRGQVEVPSDFAGVVWEAYDEAGAWRQSLARELEAAGHDIDWNKVMRA